MPIYVPLKSICALTESKTCFVFDWGFQSIFGWALSLRYAWVSDFGYCDRPLNPSPFQFHRQFELLLTRLLFFQQQHVPGKWNSVEGARWQNFNLKRRVLSYIPELSPVKTLFKHTDSLLDSAGRLHNINASNS